MWLAKSVIPECNVDSCLFNVFLQFGKDGVNHTKGNTTVVKKVREKFKDLFCVAIIDKDKRDIDFIAKECDGIVLEGMDEYFRLFQEKSKPHFFIQIVPAIEEWIWKVAKELGINIADYVAPAGSVEELKTVTKKIESKNDDRFRRLFKEFVKRAEEQNFVPVLTLIQLNKYLLEKGYAADKSEIKLWLKK